MKLSTPLFVLLFVCAVVSVNAQQVAITSSPKSNYLTQYQGLSLNTLNNPLLDSKISVLEDAPGQRMIRVGKTLTIAGSILVVGGVILMATADEIYYRSYTDFDGNTETEGDLQGAMGLALTIGGVGMIIPGAIVWSKGKKKYEAYKATGASLSLGVNRNGAGVRFNF